MLLQYKVERFYTAEAALLDHHRYEEWLGLFTDDTHYFMPIRRTVPRRELHKEFTKPGEMAFFDDDKDMLTGRVLKLRTGTAWAEDPPSRTRHLITNVRIVEDDAAGLTVESNFLLYQTRLKMRRHLDDVGEVEAAGGEQGAEVAQHLLCLLGDGVADDLAGGGIMRPRAGKLRDRRTSWACRRMPVPLSTGQRLPPRLLRQGLDVAGSGERAGFQGVSSGGPTTASERATE
ncbi:3-phenylpropionate/cinnamic acid dioxygenase small subunit [Streptosporangium album]|uniref:3-phenylpropionate/cinnamic acid dioxygenase small subunit n=1 Tax=Streptosporangium album TaxID=47479 RepID=A0A7W7WDY0_9ACTN|nr:aromatic-ring-hydroxylating dioxygenase subunit beta [Streptosporangium album]MBB4944157.1 3-phenylpropionate/cinnamic acid dioxygenase small subunit [Streptosporangium album]